MTQAAVTYNENSQPNMAAYQMDTHKDIINSHMGIVNIEEEPNTNVAVSPQKQEVIVEVSEENQSQTQSQITLKKSGGTNRASAASLKPAAKKQPVEPSFPTDGNGLIQVYYRID